jgi:hypothetical protein
LGKKLIPPGMIEVEVGVYHELNITRPDIQVLQLVEDSGLSVSRRFKGFGQSAPAGKSILENGRMGPGVKEHVSLGMKDEKNGHGALDDFIFRSIGDEHILPTPDAATTHGIESHWFSISISNFPAF